MLTAEEANEILESYSSKIGLHHSNEQIRTVFIPFTAVEWCHTCMREGEEYIGGCCGTASNIQSEVNEAFREGGYIDGESLRGVAELMISHGGVGGSYPFEKEPEVYPSVEEFKNLRPWDKISILWHLTKDRLIFQPPRQKKNHDDLEYAARVLENGFRFLDMHYMFKTFKVSTAAPAGQSEAGMSVFLARFLPALKLLNERIHELNPGDFEGFAIIDESKEAVSNGHGLCVYKTRKDAEKTLDVMGEYDSKDRLSNLQIVPVRVSATEGLCLI